LAGFVVPVVAEATGIAPLFVTTNCQAIASVD
jgi:hypothetical protein